MRDRYRTFAELRNSTREGTDWRVISHQRASNILIAAPHGGRSEPLTGTLARAIAGRRYSLYIFETLVPGLHVTSHRFTEPTAINQARRHAKVVTVHGCDNRRSAATDVFVGGLDTDMRDRVIAELAAVGFQTTIDTYTPGRERANICNGGMSGCGVQLEVTRRLRTSLANRGNFNDRRRFAAAVRRALQDQTA